MADADNAIHITKCVFSALLSYSIIMLNIITIHALRKTSVLQKNLRTWLLCLSVADLGVGLLAQPLYTTFYVMQIEQNTGNIYNNTKRASLVVTNLLCLVSLLVVSALAFDRFLAVYLHLRYREIVTHKRVVAMVILIWMLSVFLSLLGLRTSVPTTFAMMGVIIIVCLTATALFYFKIYLVVRHHAQQISVLQTQQVTQDDEQGANAARQKKSTVAVFYVYLVLLICYLPNMSIIGAVIIGKVKVSEYMVLFGDALLLLNSFLNPLIYCWKMRHINKAFVKILQNISSICVKPINTVEPRVEIQVSVNN